MLSIEYDFFFISKQIIYFTFYKMEKHFQNTLPCLPVVFILNEPPHKKTNNLHIRNQGRRSAMQSLHSWSMSLYLLHQSEHLLKQVIL